MIGYVILIILLIISWIIIFRKKNDNLRCPKCKNHMSCYHFKHILDNKEVDQYSYTCKNCGYHYLIKF